MIAIKCLIKASWPNMKRTYEVGPVEKYSQDWLTNDIDRTKHVIIPLNFCWTFFYKTHTNQNGNGILIENSRLYRTR